MLAFPKVFFELQLNFAEQVAPHFNLSFQDSLFQFTSIYIRTLGFNDRQTPQVSNPAWLQFLEALPDTREGQVNFVFNRYQAYEESKPEQPDKETYGCFSFTPHPEKQTFELHFANTDPEGNLGKDRVEARLSDLKSLASALQAQAQPNDTIFIYSWLLNIEAFQRLMPPTLINQTEVYTKNEAQSNAHWGQFVDRKGMLRTDLADKLLSSVRQRYDTINYYFPLKCLRAEMPVTEFIAHYAPK